VLITFEKHSFKLSRVACRSAAFKTSLMHY